MPPVIDAKKCIACGTCANICAMDVFGPTPPQSVPKVAFPEECWHCRACVLDCPAQAICLRYPLPLMLLHRPVSCSEEEKSK